MDKLKTQYPVIDNMNEGSGSTSTSADIPMPWRISKKSKRYKYDEIGAEQVEKDSIYNKFFLDFSKSHLLERCFWLY